jgi:hypothetical protein
VFDVRKGLKKETYIPNPFVYALDVFLKKLAYIKRAKIKIFPSEIRD